MTDKEITALHLELIRKAYNSNKWGDTFKIRLFAEFLKKVYDKRTSKGIVHKTAEKSL